MPSDRIEPLSDCPDCYGRPRGECPNCGARGIDPLNDSNRYDQIEAKLDALLAQIDRIETRWSTWIGEALGCDADCDGDVHAPMCPKWEP